MFICVVIALSASPLQAHVFDIGVIARYQGDEAAGVAFWNGMRVATRESDGHPFETSDGHLGGVDSNLVRIESSQESTELKRQVDRISQGQGTAILALDDASAELVEFFADLPSVILVAASVRPAGSREALFQAPGLNEIQEEAFRQAYLSQYGHQADDDALSGYRIARYIGQAMRVLDGHIESGAEVRQVFRSVLAP